MEEKKILAKTLPVLFGFFVMGFCDIVGISSDYAASAFGSAYQATMPHRLLDGRQRWPA